MISNATVMVGRRLVNATLTQTATIREEVAGQDAYGFPLHTPGTGVSVGCRLITAGANSRGTAGMAGERERGVTEYRLILPYGTAISTGTTVTVGDVDYRVVRVLDALASAVDVQAVVVEAD